MTPQARADPRMIADAEQVKGDAFGVWEVATQLPLKARFEESRSRSTSIAIPLAPGAKPRYETVRKIDGRARHETDGYARLTWRSTGKLEAWRPGSIHDDECLPANRLILLVESESQ